jgi:hypothetical protein
MSNVHELAAAMHTVNELRASNAHHNTLNAASRRLRKVAIECDTLYGDADPTQWASDYLTSVSSGMPWYERHTEIAKNFRNLVENG